MKSARVCVLALLGLALWPLNSEALPKLSQDKTSRIAPEIGLSFAPLPDSSRAGSKAGRAWSAPVELPLIIEFSARPSEIDLKELGQLGVEIERRRDGSPRGFVGSSGTAALAARANFKALEIIRNELDAPSENENKGLQKTLSKIKKIRLDGSPFRPPPPLDHTAKEIQASDAWWKRTGSGIPLRGEGIAVCGIDTGIDIFHPLFFKADGGYQNWADNDANGVLTPGTDTVGGAVLKTLNSAIMEYYGNDPLFGSDDPGYQLGSDFLYADLNGNNVRDYGPDQGFSESDPGFGEPLFVSDDVNNNGVVDAGEKLVMLGTSKVRAVRQGKKVYRRGTNLIYLPNNPEAAHGTSSASVMAGGALGFTRFVGIAPEAELVVGALEQMGMEFALTDFCIDEGARVVLHEYAPWLGYHLDGSSPMEGLIDSTVQQGISHINPAGNLSTSQKLYKQTILAGTQTDIKLEVPPDNPWGDFYFMGVSLLWRDTSTNLSFTLEDPTGYSMPVLGANPYEPMLSDWPNGVKYYAFREDSARGTAKVDIYLYNEGNAIGVPEGSWILHVTEPNPAGNPGLELIAFTMDDVSGWGPGIYFPEHSSEDHLIGYPGTSDHGLAVSAYTGNGFWGAEPGQRASYSGRGRRIDGVPILWIGAPDDPIAAGYREGNPALYTIFGGTSGASPHVAGAAALLIQQNPARTGADVREAIKAGALADQAVGEVPNEDFGYGKLRIYRSLFGMDPLPGGNPAISIPDSVVFVGEESAVPVEMGGNQSNEIGLEVDWDYDGIYDEALKDAVIRRVFVEEGEVLVKVRATELATGRQGAALGRITVQKAPPAPPPPVPEKKPEYEAVGGGSCGVSGAGPLKDNRIAFIFGAIGAVLLGRRRSRAN